jgi:hypothetical protein
MAVVYWEVGVGIDLDLNELKDPRAENGTGFTTGGAPSKGRFMYDDVALRLMYDDGANVQTVAILTDVAGLLDFKGGYNATTNTPNLTAGTGILKGDYYVVTVGGAFYGTTLEVGDSLFANSDTPIVLASWTIVQGNNVPASETVAGVVKLSTTALANAGSDDLTAMTPKKVFEATYLPHKYTIPSTAVGGGTPVTVTHNLGTLTPTFTIIRESTNAQVGLLVNNFTLNTMDITKNGASYNIIGTVQG